MKIILYVFLFLFAGSIYGQYLQRSSLGMSGSTSSVVIGEATYFVSASVGQQSVIGTIGNGEYTMRQGFQQPPIRVITLPENGNSLEAAVYPNPVNSFVTVTFGTLVKNDIVSTLYDVQGREITASITAPVQSFQIDMTPLASGTYILQIRVGIENFSTRLIKN